MAAFLTATLIVVAVGGALLALSRVGSMQAAGDLRARTAGELLPYSGGEPPAMHAWSRFHARYYSMALLFLAFDMEMVFMYPWAVVFLEKGIVAFVEMLMFIVILLLGILYAYRERALRWA